MRALFFSFVLLIFVISSGVTAEHHQAEIQSLPSEIASISPVQNALNVDKTTNIGLTFNIDINPLTLTNNTIKVNGSQSGLHSSSITYNSGTKTVTINPNVDFKIGEVVNVTITTGIQSTGGVPLVSPYGWSFTINVVTGEGNFAKSSETSVRAADRLTTGDFDGDGDLDLVITNPDTTTITILKNNNNGGFAKTSIVNVQSRPNGVTTGDFDGDGDIDLAVPNSPYGGLGAVSVLKNNGNGSFSQTQRLTVGNMPFAASARDFDGDGDLDLAVAMNGAGVTILLNDGNSVFTQTSTIDAPGCEFPLTAGDWDGDGDFDLAVPSHCVFGLSILKNSGSGAFAITSTVGAGNYPSDVVAGDLDSDGDLDLVVPNRNDASLSNSTVTILKNDGNGNFAQTSSPAISGANPFSVTLGDFDQDGDLDVAVNNAPYNTVSILLNDGAGNFTNSTQPMTGNGANQITTGDFDGDGDLDLAVTNSGANAGVAILKKTPPAIYPTVTSPRLAGDEFWVSVKVGDNINPVSHLFGVSFVLNFTQTDYIDVVAPYVSNIKPGLLMGNGVVFQQMVDESAGKVNIGISRKAGQTGVTGSGNVVSVKFISRASIPHGAQVEFTLTEVKAIDSTGNLLPLNVASRKITINQIIPIVWPGDTNNDGKVDQADVLPIGQYWGSTGPVRPNASLEWKGQPCPLWAPLNATYADATGNGKVDQEEVFAIGLNWGKVHTASSILTDLNLEKIETAQSPAIVPKVFPHEQMPGQEFFMQIETNEVANLFGLSFELAYDQPQLMQALAVEPDSLFGNDVVFYSNVDAVKGRIAVGISRKAGQASVNGTGAIVRVKAQVAANAMTGAKINFSLQNVLANDANGAALALNPQAASLTVGRTTGISSDAEISLPSRYRLLQNHPNPFHGATSIKYELPQTEQVVLHVYNLTGQEVLQLVNSVRQPGRYEINWNGRDWQGNNVPSGVYICRLQAGNFVQTQRMVVVR